MLIEVKNATRLFGSKRAVDDITIRIAPGERLGILGPNGSGKTTLIQLILGFLKLTSGSIDIDGKPAWPNRFSVRRRIGSLIEIPLLYPTLSARDNLLFFARFTRIDLSNVNRLLETVHLDPGEKKPFSTFSLGMKQRLGIALALMNDPELLIFDEPTNGLDPEGIVQVRGILKEINRLGKSVILCSHLLPEVEHICDSVAILQNGKVLATRNVTDLNRTGNTFRAVVKNPEAAQKIFSGVSISAAPETADAFILSLTAEQQPADTLKKLIAAGLEVEEFVRQNQGLENFFMQLMESQREASSTSKEKA